MTSASSQSLATDELIALNDELRALYRCGTPLEVGLRAVARDHSGRLREAVHRLADRIEKGTPLRQALEDEASLPPGYAAMVQAAVESRRLPDVLDGMTMALRRAKRVRNSLTSSLLYPLTVATLAFVFSVLALLYLTPSEIASVEGSQELMTIFATHRVLERTLPYWGPAVPVIVVVAVFLIMSDRTPLTRLGVARLIRDSREATFARLASRLLADGAPLPDALHLAGAASGEPELVAFAGSGRRGDSSRSVVAQRRCSAIPALANRIARRPIAFGGLPGGDRAFLGRPR